MIQNYDHCLRFQVIDKRISFIDDGAPEVVADNRGNICIHIEFDEQWDGCGKIARFIYNGKWIDATLDADGDCLCPSEVVKKGRFSLGVYGAELKTSTPIVVTVQPSILSESGEQLPEDPTPGIYDQILQQYSVAIEAADRAAQAAWDAASEVETAVGALNDATSQANEHVEGLFNKHADVWEEKLDVESKRIDELVAMRTDGGAGKYTFEDDLHDATAVITTNGAVAKLLLDVRGVMLANGDRYAFRAIPQAFAPMETVQVSEHTFGDNIVVNINSEPYEGVVLISFLNRGEETTINGDCELEYPLASLFITEVTDARVGYDGTEYATAGDAVRAAQQVAGDVVDLTNSINENVANHEERIEELEKITGAGGVLVVAFEGDSRDTASHTSSDIYSHIANGGTAVFFDGNHYSNLTMCEPNEAVFCQVWDDNTIYRLVVSADAGFEEQEIYIPKSGGGGGITVTDDGNGNVTITASSGVSITDDGSGNVSIV